MPASILALIQVLLQMSTLAPEIVAEVKQIFATLDPSAPVLTADQEAALDAVLVKINAQVQAS